MVVRIESTVSNSVAGSLDAEQITLKGIQRRELGRFIMTLEELPEMVNEFSEVLWGSMVDHVTVYAKDNIIFTLTSGMEVKA